MHLRPELVLLQKTMMTVEGVARRIQPDHDIWTAADPVVRRWMARELSPAARIRRFADEAVTALRNIARLVENPPVTRVEVTEAKDGRSGLLWFAAGAVVAGAAFLAAMYFG
jgi:ubiquinone biosynthesis protein